MSKIREIIATVAVMLTATVLLAQSPAERLKHIRERFASAKSYRIEFTSTLEEEFYDMSGSIVIDNGGRYYMDIITARIINDGIDQYVYIPERAEVTIESVKKSSKSILTNPSSLFALDERDFNVTQDRARRDGTDYQMLTLIPKEEHSDAEKIRLYIDGSDMPKIIEVVMAKGRLFTMKIDAIYLPYPTSEKTFTFSKERFPETEIIDLR